MLSPTYEITTALSHTDELISPPYDIAIVTISYGRVIMSSVWDSMMSKKNVGWPFYAAVITGLVMGLIFRLTGGEPLLGLPPAIKYPWWYEDDGVIYQNFPFKTLAMLISLICIVSVSLITHACFTNGILSEDMDVLSGVVRRRWVSQSNGNLRESNGNISADEGVENPVFVTRL